MHEGSCQPCGCDAGAKYVCEWHTLNPVITGISQSTWSGFGGYMPPPEQKTDAQLRKEYPLATGCLDYFPLALMEVAHVSYLGNEQHHPGEPLHWDRSKSSDEPDACMRHFKDRGTFDTDGARHTAKAAWRILALLQKELEAEGQK